jgi:hypothetical protein
MKTWKHEAMRRIAIIGVLAIIALTFSTCFSEWKGEEAVIVINFGGGGNGRQAAWPPAESGILGQLNYKITLSSGTDSKPLDAKGTDTIRVSVTPGLWKVTIEADYDGILFATGISDYVNVIAGQENFVTVPMTETDYTFFVVASDVDWYNAGGYINEPGDNNNNKNYVITVTKNITVSTLSLNVPCYVIIRGSHNAVTAVTLNNSVTGPLISIENPEAEVIMRDLKLVGHEDNNTALVTVVRGSFTMEGGASVSGNTNNDPQSRGGGVSVSDSTFIMKDDASVSDNIALGDSGGETVGNGGGVYISSSRFTMMDKAIVSKNKSCNGGGVYVIIDYMGGSTFIIQHDASVSDNEAIAYGGGVFVAGGGTFTMEGGVLSKNEAESGGGVYVDAGSEFGMESGSIYGNQALGSGNSGNGGGVYVYSGTFNMTGGTIGGTGSANTANNNGGGVYLDNGILNMYDSSASVSGNKASNGGGGVYVGSYSTFTMESGSISGNIADSGGGVAVVGPDSTNDISTFDMKGGTISGNTAQGVGGGVSVSVNSTITSVNSGKFRIESGIVYGKNDPVEGNRNIALDTINDPAGAALFLQPAGGIIRAEYGKFIDNTFDSMEGGPLYTRNDTLRVLNGGLQ